ncbi:PREDICTED: vitamin K epoxide reductase complex subunit 1-like protein 1, partial [Pterocles gutturalis]|uniref:vitamin K epoxide reductase complex subunit 1-like protein 1 n=1 Tax=Pterocles gutturalis TaxID=240206 RepID=UPI0005287A3F
GRGLGLVEVALGRDSVANVPNGALGVAFYLLQGLLGSFPGRAASAALLGTAVASLVASLWLAGVLAFGLRDICVICVTTYILNALLFLLACRRWRGLPRPKTA